MRWWTNMRGLVVTRSCSKFPEYCCRQHGAATWGPNRCRFGARRLAFRFTSPSHEKARRYWLNLLGFLKRVCLDEGKVGT